MSPYPQMPNSLGRFSVRSETAAATGPSVGMRTSASAGPVKILSTQSCDSRKRRSSSTLALASRDR